jgi:hypothetical protein
VIVASLLLIFAAVVMLVVGVAEHADPALIGSIVATLLAVIVLIGSARRAATVRLAAAADGTGMTPTVHSGPSSGMVIDGTLVERPANRTPGGTPPRQASAAAAGHFEVNPFEADPSASDVPFGRTVQMAEPDEYEGATTIPAQPRTPLDFGIADEGLDGEDFDEDLDDPSIEFGLRPVGHPGPGDDELGEFDDEDPPDEPAVQLVSAGDQALIARMETSVLVVDGRPRYHLARCPHLTGRATEALPAREAVELGFSPCARCEPATALLAGARQN